MLGSNEVMLLKQLTHFSTCFTSPVRKVGLQQHRVPGRGPQHGLVSQVKESDKMYEIYLNVFGFYSRSANVSHMEF